MFGLEGVKLGFTPDLIEFNLFILLGVKYRIVKICLEEVYDIFIINDLCIFLLHTQYTLVLFFITLFKFCKSV